MREDDGAVAVLVALLAVVLFGFGALVIDVGALYSERRQLQNGSDAGALAVAQLCAGGSCGAFLADARGFASGNAVDDVSRVETGEVCGLGPGLPACTNPPTGLAGDGYVRVTARTRETDGTNLVPPALASVLVPGYSGKDVSASSTVIWGSPGGVDAQLAITFSQCEYKKLTQDAAGNTVYAPPYTAALERTIYFHDTTEASTCPAGPSGADLPGGFGWLDPDAGCRATITNGWAGDNTGVSASKACKQALEDLYGKTVFIPVFDGTNGLSGNNGEYHIWSYVAFVLTGWNFSGTQQNSTHQPSGKNNPCKSSQTCLSGFFIEAVAPGGGPVSGGPDQGVRVVQLVS